MSSNGRTERGREAIGQAEKLVRLRAELEVERLRFEVALAVAVSIHEEVPLPSDQTLVIEDLIARWHGLTPVEQAGYEASDSQFSPLTKFVWDMVEKINAEPFAGYTDETYPPEAVAEEIGLKHWRNYLARLREAAGIRALAGSSGSAVPAEHAPPEEPAATGTTPEAQAPSRAQWQPLRYLRPVQAAQTRSNESR